MIYQMVISLTHAVVSIHLECFVAHEFEECLAHPVLLYLYM